MFQILSVVLRNTICFGKVRFDVTPGLHAVYGLNRTNARRSGNGNAAGKSALFSQVGEIAYEDPVVGEKEDKVTTGYRQLRTSFNNKSVIITRQSSKLEVKIDGKNRFRTKPQARAWLAENLPISREDFDTYVHLDSRVPHPLVMGSTTERKRFITRFCGLDKMDVERRLFTAELEKLAKIRAAHDELVNEFTTSKESILSQQARAALKADIEDLDTRVRKLNKKATGLQDIRQLLTFEHTADEQIQSFLNLVVEGSDSLESEFTRLAAEHKLNSKENRKGLEDAEAWHEYRQLAKHYNSAVAELSEPARATLDKYGSSATKKYRGVADALIVLQQELADVEKTVEQSKAFLSAAAPSKILPPAKSKQELHARLEALTHRLAHATKFKKGVCDSCGQSVDVVDPDEIRDRIKKTRALITQHAEAEEWSTYCKERKEARASLESVGDRPTVLKEKIKKYREYLAIHRELRELPEQPRKFEGRKLEFKVMQRMVEEDQERERLLSFIEPNVGLIVQLVALTKEQRQHAEDSQRLQTALNKAHDDLSRKRAELEVDTIQRRKLLRIRDRIKELKLELENEEALKLLVAGYSDKQMKRLAVRAFGDRLIQEVNKYAPYVFTENYEFGFSWEASRISLTATRRQQVGSKVRTLTSDVRKLSGAESKLFTIVLVLALLTFVPPRKRCNLLILDEPTANMSEETIKGFNSLLPVLNKVIPSIVIITPKKEQYPNATCWTVVKDNGVSRLEKGHPSQIRKTNA